MKTFLAILSICLVSSSFSEAHILSDPVPNKQTVQIPQQCMPLYQKYVQLQQQYQVIHQYLLKLTSDPNQKVFISQGSQSVGSLQRQVGGGSKDYVVRGSEKPSSAGLIDRVIEGAGQAAGDALRMTGDADTQKVFISQGSQSGGSRQRQGGDSVDYVVKGSEIPSSVGVMGNVISRGGNMAGTIVNTDGQVDYNSGSNGRVVEGARQAAGDALSMTGDADTQKVFISQGSQSGGSRQRQVEGDSIDYIIKGSETPSSISFNPSILSRGGNTGGIIVNTDDQVDSGLLGRVVDGAGHVVGDALRTAGDAVFQVDKGINNIFRNLRK